MRHSGACSSQWPPGTSCTHTSDQGPHVHSSSICEGVRRTARRALALWGEFGREDCALPGERQRSKGFREAGSQSVLGLCRFHAGAGPCRPLRHAAIPTWPRRPSFCARPPFAAGEPGHHLGPANVLHLPHPPRASTCTQLPTNGCPPPNRPSPDSPPLPIRHHPIPSIFAIPIPSENTRGRTGYGLRITGDGLRATGYGLRAV